MDKGAHFHKSDFQVHTPRDANWQGARATTPAERKAYAEELVRACRERGLDAIGITDHHDFAFFPYVRAAAANEVDAAGRLLPPEKRLIVFPGVELTLSSPPCQAILLLDSDFDERKLPDILTALAISPTDEALEKLPTVETVSPAAVTGLTDLEAKLNLQRSLSGRFIILPNVTDGGYKSLLRTGFQGHYKDMSCVGGYVDGDYSSASVGMKNILEGRQQNNGYKAIGVFQTSDSRTRDHAALGVHSTYVKWSEPTAEALRQACLARESRICLSEPELPPVWIVSLTVTNSKFLGHFTLDLNQQYNALIGGRGTGKSTILEYLRWGLCDQPSSDDELDPVQQKRKTLVEATLQDFDGDVHVTLMRNGVLHVVKRSSKHHTIQLRVGDSDFQAATEQQIRALLPVQAYSQKQLSSVSVRLGELRRFVELPIQRQLDDFTSALAATRTQVRAAYGSVMRKRELASELRNHDMEQDSLAKQVDALRKGLKGLSDAERKVLERKPLYDAEAAAVDLMRNALAKARGRIDALRDAFTLPAFQSGSDEVFENADLIAGIRAQVEAKLGELQSGVAKLSEALSPEETRIIEEHIASWTQRHIAFLAEYEAATAKAKASQQQLDQIASLDARMAELKKQSMERKDAVEGFAGVEEEYERLRSVWKSLQRDKLKAISEQCAQFATLSDGLIRADVRRSLDSDALFSILKRTFAGMNVREERLLKLCEWLMESVDSVTEWSRILDELEVLALLSSETSKSLPDLVLLRKFGFTENELQRVAGKLDWSSWVDLSLSDLQFAPQFSYCTNAQEGEYIDFANASAGQQATALLTVLLNQAGPPLLIDQPEDDIDSKIIREIVEKVWRAKRRRQLLFASHNANFVVNGDADLVVCCDYRRAGDQTKGEIRELGAIDNAAIRDAITLVTEGGREAFKLRMDKYGF